MKSELRQAIETFLKTRVERVEPCGGGDINEAYALTLAGGDRVFAKTNGKAPPGMFGAEAHGLEWLSEGQTIRVPSVYGVSENPPFLLLEFLESSPKKRQFDEELGRSLARLHRITAPSFGLERDNFIGRLPQSNRTHARFVDFYRSERLVPQFEKAQRAGLLSSGLERAFSRVAERLEDWLGPEEPPARLHGDLWGGNLHVGPNGEPCLIDPAVYGGHREIDLAMMRLFGGFDERVFEAYAEAYPLASGYASRVPLFQLYPLLVHVNHFGSSYVPAVERALASLA